MPTMCYEQFLKLFFKSKPIVAGSSHRSPSFEASATAAPLACSSTLATVAATASIDKKKQIHRHKCGGRHQHRRLVPESARSPTSFFSDPRKSGHNRGKSVSDPFGGTSSAGDSNYESESSNISSGGRASSNEELSVSLFIGAVVVESDHSSSGGGHKKQVTVVKDHSSSGLTDSQSSWRCCHNPLCQACLRSLETKYAPRRSLLHQLQPYSGGNISDQPSSSIQLPPTVHRPISHPRPSTKTMQQSLYSQPQHHHYHNIHHLQQQHHRHFYHHQQQQQLDKSPVIDCEKAKSTNAVAVVSGNFVTTSSCAAAAAAAPSSRSVDTTSNYPRRSLSFDRLKTTCGDSTRSNSIYDYHNYSHQLAAPPPNRNPFQIDRTEKEK